MTSSSRNEGIAFNHIEPVIWSDRLNLSVAHEMLDEEHEALEQDNCDYNIYLLGRTGEHNVVTTCLLADVVGNDLTAVVATQMWSALEAVFHMASHPHQGFGGVIQFDFGKSDLSGFQRTEFLYSLPVILLTAATKCGITKFKGRAAGPDVLFQATFNQEGGPTCGSCGAERRTDRAPRAAKKPVVHYHTIASGNRVIKTCNQQERYKRPVWRNPLLRRGGSRSREQLSMSRHPRHLRLRRLAHEQELAAVSGGTVAAYAKEQLLEIPLAEELKT
ncbi:hypothetical protein CC78DRAFT_543219 [Lojkania enalia]|uniref:Uncharacterized protein n=1 Tax=Lojkania enalia TaxID=147567 RepID=A0A9P4N8L8_9PLEO|nr:hypothetical protein CC78DRAFT_543219 [Didymosphaeria enalia]